MTFIGTAFFENKKSAVNYYAKQEVDETSVKEYIEEGLICIGKPANTKIHDLSIDSDGRYWSNEWIKNEGQNQ